MAPNSRSNLHVDAYQTDVHQGPGPLGKRHVAGRDVPERRLRVGDVRLARADRDRLRRRRRAEAVPDGRADARDAGHVPAAAARARRRQHLQRLRRRRLLLPRRARPGRDPDDLAPRARRAPDRRRLGLRARARLRPHGAPCRSATRSSPRCPTGAAASGSSPRAGVVGIVDRATRRGDRAAAARADRELVRGRRGRRRLPRHGRRRCTGSTRARAASRSSPGARSTRTPGSSKPGQVGAGLGHDADAARPRPGRDHRQRRPDERRRLPARAERPTRRARSACSPCSRRARARPTTR